MSKQYVTKVYRQRSSLVTSVPIEVRKKLELTNKDHLVWQVDERSNFVQVSKVVAGGKNNGRDNGNSDRKDKGG